MIIHVAFLLIFLNIRCASLFYKVIIQKSAACTVGCNDFALTVVKSTCLAVFLNEKKSSRPILEKHHFILSSFFWGSVFVPIKFEKMAVMRGEIFARKNCFSWNRYCIGLCKADIEMSSWEGMYFNKGIAGMHLYVYAVLIKDCV